jgi:hypothetical protein
MVGIVSVYRTGIVRAVHTDGTSWSRRLANEIELEATFEAPAKSGNLRSSHSVQNRNQLGQYSTGHSVVNSARHAAWVHNGTGVYGPRGMPIFPVNTPQRKYMHVPPGYGFLWKITTRKGVPFYDVSDPYGHLEMSLGTKSNPWLLRAARTVLAREGLPGPIV